MQARIVTALLLALATAFGCGTEPSPGGSPGPSPTDAGTATPLTANVSLVVAGAVQLSVEREAGMLVTETGGPGMPAGRRLLSAGLAPAVDVDGRRVTVSFALRPGSWKGPGLYELSNRPAEAADGAGSSVDVALLEIMRSEPAEMASFSKIAKPCTVELGERGYSGRLDCPELEGDRGAVASVVLRWEGRPGPTPTPERIITPQPRTTASPG